MLTVGEIKGLSPYSVVVKGTGDPATDNTNLNSAVSKLNGWGKGTLYIDGQVYLTSSKNFTSPISLKGLDNNAEIISKNATDGFDAFTWNRSFNMATISPTYDISTHKEKAEYIDVSGTGYTPTSGEWIVVWSEDTIEGVEPHNVTYIPKPMEVHQVANYNPATQVLYPADFIVDQLSTSGKLAVLNMLDGVVVENLNFSHEGGQGQYVQTLFFQTCSNLTVRNVRIKRDGSGSIWFGHCANVKASDIIIEGAKAWEYVYAFVCGPVNGLTIRDCNISGTRHAFTTTAGLQVGTTKRYGTPLNVVVDNCQAYIQAKLDPSGILRSRVGFDTHAEGWGIEFKNCLVILDGDAAQVGMQSRSRHTIFDNCRVIGSYSTDTGNGAKAIRIQAKDNIVKNCYIEGTWRGVETQEDQNSGVAKNLLISNCVFKHLTNSAIFLNQGSGHQITDCSFYDCGAIEDKDIIEITEGSGHVIQGCYLPRYSNDLAINQNGLDENAITVLNNTFFGYDSTTSSGPMGFNQTTGASYEQKYSNRNITELGFGHRKDGQDALGVVTGVINIDFDSLYYDNKSLVLADNVTISLSGIRPGQYNLLISQDAVGGYSITWTGINWINTEVQPATGVFAVTPIQFYNDGQTFYGFTH